MGHRVNSWVLLGGLLVGGLFAASASAQQHAGTGQHAQPSTLRGGLIGQRVAMPNVLGRGGTLPIHRQITLPGLSSGQVQPQYGRVGVPGVVGQRGYDHGGYDHGDGVRIEGRYEGDKFSLNFHLGSGADLYHRRYSSPYGYGRYGYSSYPSLSSYSSGAYLSTQPVDGVLTRQVDSTLRSPGAGQPARASEPEREWTAIEVARLFMAADELDRSIEAFRDHLDEDGEDVEAMRDLGVAMIEAGRLEDGIAMIAMAYRTDPVLARTALDVYGLGLDGRRYDALLSRVLGFARKTDSGSAHLAGVMLLQGDRKVAGALRVLDRAERAGLASEVVDAFRRELGVVGRR